jgi:hypothetical protein
VADCGETGQALLDVDESGQVLNHLNRHPSTQSL